MISLLEEQRGVQNKGASMRLGTWPTKIAKGTLAEKIYGNTEVMERHRHRYEFNMKYRDQMNEKGFAISRHVTRWTLAELIELARSSIFSRLPVSSGISKQAEQTASAFQRIHSGVPRISEVVRRAPQAIQNRRAESLIRNSFCNDKIDIELVELAQITKQIRSCFT